jgi:hypothetical protein
VRLGEHRLEQVEVLLERGGRVVVLAEVAGGRRHHEGDAVVFELGHGLRRVDEDPVDGGRLPDLRVVALDDGGPPCS